MPATLTIAFPMRVDALDKPGGDVEHMRTLMHHCTLAAARRGMEFHAQIITELNPALTGYDVVHLTNLDRPVDLYAQFHAAQSAKLPIVLTPLHHSYREIERYESSGRGGWIGKVSSTLGFYRLEALRIAIKSRRYRPLLPALISTLRTGMLRAQAEILRGCNFIIVTTEKEAADIASDIAAVDPSRLILLRYGVDPDAAAIKAAAEAVRDIDIAVIARIESRKNQIAILDAVESLGLRATFVGPPNPNHAAYTKELRRRIGAGQSTFIPGIPPAKVAGMLARARVHVAASWFEVSSLVDLDAYLAGCRVVASRCGGTREILGEDAWYVDPGSPQEIRAAISAALASAEAGQQNDLEQLRGRLTGWDEVADRLLDLYLSARDEGTRVAAGTLPRPV